MHLEKAITLWLRAVWACKTSIFSCHPRRKTITFIQRDGQHLKSSKNRLNIHYLSSSPSLLIEKQDANTHPCFKIYRKPVRHIDHLEPLFNFFIEVHFTQVFPLTCLQNTERDYITFGLKMPQKLLMICSYLEDIPERHTVTGIFSEYVPLVIENMTLNDAGASWNWIQTLSQRLNQFSTFWPSEIRNQSLNGGFNPKHQIPYTICSWLTQGSNQQPYGYNPWVLTKRQHWSDTQVSALAHTNGLLPLMTCSGCVHSGVKGALQSLS